MIYQDIYPKVEEYVEQLFVEHNRRDLTFHNLEHTRNVVNNAKEIAAHSSLSDDDSLIIYVAAWFHDAGYLTGNQQNHEEESVRLMKEFMERFDVKNEIISQIENCILATRSPRNPQNLNEEILCDADTFHFGTKKFRDSNESMFKELQHVHGSFSRKRFDEGTLTMLKEHTFFTRYAKENLNDYKKKIMKKVKKKKNKEEELSEVQATVNPDAIVDDNRKVSDIKATSIMSKGIQTMLRLTSSNHIQLSDMADNKANILISVNAIIISVILSVLLRKLQTDPYLTIPTLIFLASSVVTIVIAILATRPKLNLGTFENQDIIDKKTNLLFFGNFHRMPLEDYNTAMTVMMKDPDYLYSSMIQDIYHLGVVLGKKYRLLRVAYNVFMWGIIISVTAFAVASLLNSTPDPTVTHTGGSPF